MITTKHHLLFFIFALASLGAGAQGEGNIWVFGDHAGLDFNTGNAQPISSSIVTIEGSASVCSKAGQLLFYTEGSTIWDRVGNPTPNGVNITGLNLPGFSATASTTQSSLIVPMPDSAGKYFVFSLTDGTIASKHNLYYSVVDMNLNSGLGDIVPGRKGILIDSMLSEKLTSVLGKCCNIWVVVNKSNGNFHAFQITGAGLNTTPISSPSGINNGFGYNYGEIKFSHDGNKMAAVSQLFFGLKMYDFDGYTGVFSNIKTIKNKDFYGTCFSPDNSKLYAASDSLYQYDVSSGNISGIIASEKKLARTGGLTDVKLAPNGKIYFQGPVGLSVVNNPNVAGPASQVVGAAVLPLSGTYIIFGGLSNEVSVLKRDTAAFTKRDTTVCFRDSIILTGPPVGCDYMWEDGSTGITHTANHNGNYVVSYHTPPCVFHRDTITVHFASAVPFAGAYSGCGKTGTAYLFLHPGAGDVFPYQYTWKDNVGNQLQQHTSTQGDTLFGINSGTYTVRMSGNGCDTIISLFLPLPQQVFVNFTTDSIICLGQTSTFNNLSSGFNNYLWLFGDGDSSILAQPTHIYAHPGVYHVSLVGYPCADTLTKTVTVDTTSFISFITEKEKYCLGEEVKCIPTYPGGITHVAWSFGDGTFGASMNQGHAYEVEGTYVIHVKAYFRACADTAATDTVHVYPYPIVNLGADTFMCPGSEPMRLANEANTPPYYKYLWNTGDTIRILTAIQPGLYALTITNEYGCSGADSIDIKKSCYLDIPNAFTPNGDGVNDYFFPRDLLKNALSAFHMQIFNRWGEVIYDTRNIQGRGWDGSFNDKGQAQGVYIYLIEASFINGSLEKFQGNVTLLR